MNAVKSIGFVSLAVGSAGDVDWIAIIGLVILILGVVQEFLKSRKDS